MVSAISTAAGWFRRWTWPERRWPAAWPPGVWPRFPSTAWPSWCRWRWARSCRSTPRRWMSAAARSACWWKSGATIPCPANGARLQKRCLSSSPSTAAAAPVRSRPAAEILLPLFHQGRGVGPLAGSECLRTAWRAFKIGKPALMDVSVIPLLLALWPLFALIVAGYVLRRQGFPSEAFWPGAERLNYFILFPALLFNSLATAPLDNPALPRLAGAVLLGLALVWVALLVIKRLRAWPAARFGAMAQGGLRFNTYL